MVSLGVETNKHYPPQSDLTQNSSLLGGPLHDTQGPAPISAAPVFSPHHVKPSTFLR